MSVKRFSLALVLCAAMAFTACDKEGGNQPGPDTDPVTPTENTVDVAYAIGGGADFLLIFEPGAGEELIEHRKNQLPAVIEGTHRPRTSLHRQNGNNPHGA